MSCNVGELAKRPLLQHSCIGFFRCIDEVNGRMSEVVRGYVYTAHKLSNAFLQHAPIRFLSIPEILLRLD